MDEKWFEIKLNPEDTELAIGRAHRLLAAGMGGEEIFQRELNVVLVEVLSQPTAEQTVSEVAHVLYAMAMVMYATTSVLEAAGMERLKFAGLVVAAMEDLKARLRLDLDTDG